MAEETVQTEVPEGSEIIEVPAVEAPEQVAEETAEPVQTKSQNSKQRLRRKLAEEAAERERLAEENRKLTETVTDISSRLERVENPLPERPRQVDFDSEEAYEDAVYSWRKEKESRENGSAPSEPSTPAEAKPASEPQGLPFGLEQEQFDSWLDRYDDAVEKYDDFVEVVEADGVPITDVMAQTLMLQESGADIAYHLAKNVDEAKRIARMPFAEQAAEIKALAGKFNNSVTNAPEPIETIGGSDSFAGKDPEKMSPEEYRDWRRNQMAQ